MKRNGKHIDKDGDERWYKDGKLHRTDGPACTYPDGKQEWWQNGELHRTDGPAVIHTDGSQYWYKDGIFHRDDGPSFTIQNDSKNNGVAVWRQDGMRHRTDGPAIIHQNGDRYWFIKDKQVSESEFLIRKEGLEFDEMMRELLSV